MKSFLLTAFSFYRPRLRHHQEEVGLGTIWEVEIGKITV
jgi:hypothetical protein